MLASFYYHAKLGAGGIEPTTNWLKARCSTTELHPHVM
jgi:hypothetical protein